MYNSEESGFNNNLGRRSNPKNFEELDSLEVKRYTSEMLCVYKDKDKIDNLITGIKDLSTQLGKLIYPSHNDFLTLERGLYWIFNEEPVYLYVTRYDGDKGLISKEINKIDNSVDFINILEIGEVRRNYMEPDYSGYKFESKNKDNSELVKFGAKSVSNKLKNYNTFRDLEELLDGLRKYKKILFDNPELLNFLRKDNNFSREGYL